MVYPEMNWIPRDDEMINEPNQSGLSPDLDQWVHLNENLKNLRLTSNF